MITHLAAAALLSGALLQQTDTTFAAGDATRLDLENQGGEVIVNTWDRDEIRIQAEHSSRSFIEIDRRGRVIQIEADARRGPAMVVDYQITVPRAMDLTIEGMYTAVEINGTEGAVKVETLEGDVTVRGGQGEVTVETVNGEILVEDARGRMDVSSVSRSVRVRGSSGEVLAETVSGHIIMENVSARLVEAGTVSGRIVYDGTIADDGRYAFGAHSGRIHLRLPEGVNATVSAASLSGTIRADYPGAPSSFERHRRNTFTLGSGSAQIEMETFTGGIVIDVRDSSGG